MGIDVMEVQVLSQITTWGRFHKPIYALLQALTLCAKLLRLKKASQKLGAERKSLAQSKNGFMKSTHGQD